MSRNFNLFNVARVVPRKAEQIISTDKPVILIVAYYVFNVE